MTQTITQAELREFAETGRLPAQAPTTPRVAFVIPGDPIGKPRMTQRDKWAQRACVMRYRAWADAARLAAGTMPDPRQIKRLDWIAYIEPPKSWSAKKKAAALGTLHRSRPDRDNIDKALLDVLFKEDSAIALGTIEKRWGSPARIEVRIELESAVPSPANLKGP